MKALVKKEPKKGLWLEEVQTPKPKPNEVLIRVKKAAICGTDVHIYQWDDWAQKTVPTPLTIGHEFMGEVTEVGSSVQRIKVGDRVSVEGHIVCNKCRNCLRGKLHLCVNTIGIGVHQNGGFADFVAVPEQNVFLLEAHISDEVGAFLDPLGNATHTALSFDLTGEDVWVIGAGPIGLMAAAIARKVGARNVFVTDVNEFRLKKAKEMGATHVVNIQKDSLEKVMKEAGIEYGFDVVLEMSGNEMAIQSMLKHTMLGAKVALLGIPAKPITLDLNDLIFKGIELKGIYGREMFETWYKMSSLLQSGLQVQDVVTHRFKKEDYEQAFEAMISGKSGKVILDWENQ